MIKIKFVQIHTYRSVLLTKAFLATQQLTVPLQTLQLQILLLPQATIYIVKYWYAFYQSVRGLLSFHLLSKNTKIKCTETTVFIGHLVWMWLFVCHLRARTDWRWMTVQCWERHFHTRGKKEQRTGENWVSDGLHNLHCSPNIIWVIKPRNTTGATCVKWILLRMDDKDRINLAQCSGQAVGPCEQNDDPRGSIKFEEFLD